MQKTYFNGLPTRIDVDLLIKVFGVPKEGSIISYEEIEKVIREEYGSTRFRTVTDAWRRCLDRDHNTVTEAIPGEAFLVLPPAGRVKFSGKKVKTGKRFIRRGGAIAARTDRKGLSEEEVASCDYYKKVAAAISITARVMARRLPKGKALGVSP